MPPSVLTTAAYEKSTYIINAVVYDEDDNAVIPVSMTWTLTDEEGTTINSRVDIDYETDKGTGVAGTLSTSMDIVLHGNDLQAVGTDQYQTRVLTLEGTYNSSAGNGLEFKDRVYFTLDNFVAVS